MNKIIFNPLFLVLFFFSCSKQKRIESKLNGFWRISKVYIEDGEGFFHDGNQYGQLQFSTNEKNCIGMVNYNYINQNGVVLHDSLKLNSKYQINAVEDRVLFLQNLNLYNFRILLLTKSDLQIEFYDLDNYRLTKFIFEKS
jgi:hypothetical protein